MKSELFQKIAVAALAVFALNACSKNDATPQQKAFSKGSIEDAIASGQTTPKEASEEMALAAEQLAQSANFSYAQRLAKLSLAVDPTNVRARLWNAILAPTMELKGIVTRLEPLAQKNPARYRQYLEEKAKIEKDVPVKSVRDFMLKGPKDVQSEEEIQATLSAITMRMDELRLTLKDLKNEELTIYRNPETVTDEDRWNESMKSCTASSENGTITVHGCDLTRAYQVKLNGADFMVMQQAVAGYQLYIGLLNTYSVHGAIEAADKSRNSTEIMTRLYNDPKFGKIRDGRNLAVIPDVALDAVLAARSAVQLQRDLCAQQGQSTWSREGYLIGEGSCELPDNRFEAALQTIEMLAKGPADLFVNNKGRSTAVKVDLVGFTRRPLIDVRSLQPTPVRTPCGTRLEIGDKTLGGLFPQGDSGLLDANDCQ